MKEKKAKKGKLKEESKAPTKTENIGVAKNKSITNKKFSFPSIFLVIYELHEGIETWKIVDNLTIPFIKTYTMMDLTNIVAEGYNNIKHKAFIFAGDNSEFDRDNLEIAQALKDPNQELKDLNTQFFYAKIMIYTVKLRIDYKPIRWENYKKPANMILIESEGHVGKFVYMPILNQYKQPLTIRDVRCYFAWKSNVLPQHVGLRNGSKIFTNDKEVVKVDMRYFQAFFPLVDLPMTNPLPPKQDELYLKRNAFVQKEIVVKCVNMTPKYITIPLSCKDGKKLTIREAANKVSMPTLTDCMDIYLYEDNENFAYELSSNKKRLDFNTAVADINSYFITAEKMLTRFKKM